MYYLLYPRASDYSAILLARKPTKKEENNYAYKFAEGGYKTKKEALIRARWMNIKRVFFKKKWIELNTGEI